jgi:hypothetical protein
MVGKPILDAAQFALSFRQAASSKRSGSSKRIGEFVTIS